ncbi:MAG: ABC transporter permease [Deltaproteobacteria bacterium]|nr:ABC transporter permease [Deltaproteobacteria bacterium]
MIANAVLMALRQLRRNPMRSLLTTLGILIGVAAVIAMVMLGRGAQDRIASDLSGMGKNLLFVMPGSPAHGPGGPGAGGARTFRVEDARAIERTVPDLAVVVPVASRSMVAVAGSGRWVTSVSGTDNGYLTALSWQLAHGRAFNLGELRAGAAVCILGDRVRRELYPSQDVRGVWVRLGTVSCRVIGALSPKGTSTFGQDQDNFVLMPLRTFQRRVAGTEDVAVIFLSAVEGASTERIKARTETLMRERRHIHTGEDPDFNVRDMKEVARMVGSITGVLTSLLAAIASVSLLVGGIGIMNIMLVAVTERTREIGIRLAIGARAREVMVQFLVESVVLSMVGGLAGIGVGLGASLLATRKLGLPFEWQNPMVLLAFAFAMVIGVLFGWVPARKAAHLDPIAALRHE